MTRRQLIIIPGLGDRGRLYRVFKPLWMLFGFRVHIFVFGWESETSIKAASQGLLDFIDARPGKVGMIGVSAGGTAAVNALANRLATIDRVVTVCSPYSPVPHLMNQMLAKSIDNLGRSFQSLDKATKSRILSVHGVFDPVVPIDFSRPKDIRVLGIRSRGHGLSIFLALTLFSSPIKRFLKDFELPSNS